IVEGMEELRKIENYISKLNQKIKNTTQTKSADLLNNLKSEIIKAIDSLDFKRHKDEILTIIEQNFENTITGDFANNLYEQIEKEFDETSKPIENTSESIFQYRNDLKMLLLNMLSNFETKMNKIHELLKENQESLFMTMKNLEIKIAESLNQVIQNSINEVSNLNKPIEDVMRNYIQGINLYEKSIIKNVWTINSVTKVNEEIQDLIEFSQENLDIIIPHIENHIAFEQFEKIADSLKIKIVSSEAHTNSVVKSLASIKNFIYRTYRNENLIFVNGDNKKFIMGFIQDSKDPLDDFLGFGSTFEPLIKQLDPLIKNIWENAYSDTFHGTQMAKTQPIKITPSKALTAAKPIIPTKIQSQKIENERTKPTISIPHKIQEIPTGDIRSTKGPSKSTPSSTISTPQIVDLKQKLQEKVEFLTAVQPIAGDEAAIIINTAFNNLIQELEKLKGDEFGKKLQAVADLILEKKGFSVTLHKIRSTINKYKEKINLLEENEKKEILEDIENWKRKIF
ncbi:MAG: hypothetical protein ACFE75_03505, partial [Candidatus Hodarchaeota archaeon]